MLSFYFPPRHSGSAIQALNLSVHLQRQGVEPFFVAANLTDSASYEVVSGIPVHRVPVAKSPEFQVPSFWFSAGRFLRQRRSSFDIIHAHGTVQHGIAAVMGAYLRKPTILKVAMANSDLAFERQGRVFGGANRYLVRRFDRYIATTAAIADEFADRGLDVSRVRRIPNGVDTDVYVPLNTAAQRAELRRELGFPPEPLVTCVAVVNERKNIDGVLRIWQQVVKRGVAGHLAIVGPLTRPDYHKRLLCYVRKHRLLSRVSFVGSQDIVRPFLQASDAFLFPSRREGMPNAVLEAMACGVPCLISRGTALTEVIVDGRNGYSVDADDEAEFGTRLVGLLSDAGRQTQMSTEAREHVVKKFSLGTVATEYRRLYEELLQID